MAQYLQLQKNEILAITKKYNLKQISFEPIEEGAGNTSYLVQTAQRQYILTIFEIEITE
jgi:Ser/Thr protein kinase RdoA (MazF antagonist)